MSKLEETPDTGDTGENSVSSSYSFVKISFVFFCQSRWFIDSVHLISVMDSCCLQNASSSDTLSSRGKGEDFEAKLECDRGKRFDYLLKQTEIFSHFMSSQPSKTPTKPKTGRPKKPKPEEPAETAAGE